MAMAKSGHGGGLLDLTTPVGGSKLTACNISFGEEAEGALFHPQNWQPPGVGGVQPSWKVWRQPLWRVQNPLQKRTSLGTLFGDFDHFGVGPGRGPNQASEPSVGGQYRPPVGGSKNGTF